MKARLFYALTAVSFLLVACSDGDTSKPPQDDPPDSPGISDSPSSNPPSSSSNSSSFNGGFTGRLVTADDGTSSSIDLATGRVSPLPLDVISRAVDRDAAMEFDDPDYVVHASDQTVDAALVQTYLRCTRPDAGEFGNACYAVYDNDLNLTGTFMRLNRTELDVGARLSRSRERIVTVDYARANLNGAGGDYIVHIETRNVATGDREMRLKMGIVDTIFDSENRRGAPAVEWGVDDALIYTNALSDPPEIFITKPNSAEVARSIKLPSRLHGIISDLHLSPDGTKLLIRYERFDKHSGSFAIVLDLQSLSVTMPVMYEWDTVPLGDEGLQANTYTLGWSPDGEWLLLGARTPITSDVETGGGGVSSNYNLIAVPATSNNAVYSLDAESRSPEIVSLQYHDLPNSDRLSRIPGKRQYIWLP